MNNSKPKLSSDDIWGYIFAIIVIAGIFAVITSPQWFPIHTTYNRTESIDGGQYFINATADRPLGFFNNITCTLNSVTYYKANASGIYFIHVSNTSSILKYLISSESTQIGSEWC